MQQGVRGQVVVTIVSDAELTNVAATNKIDEPNKACAIDVKLVKQADIGSADMNVVPELCCRLQAMPCFADANDAGESRL